MNMIPETPFEITLVGGRTMQVWGCDTDDPEREWLNKCERTGQAIYNCTCLRSWTYNGEHVSEDVLLTLISGAESVKPIKPYEENQNSKAD